MLTNYFDDKTGDKFSVGMPVWTIDLESEKRVEGEVLEVGEDSIKIKWEDLTEETEYERSEIELRGDQVYNRMTGK